MKLEQQVCALEQAKRLRELGVSQVGIWTWIFPALSKMLSTTYGVYYHSQAKEIIDENEGTEFDHDYASAFTVAELGEMLPTGYDTMKLTANLPDEYLWYGYNENGEDFPYHKGYKNEAECRATMLIHLIESNLITTEEINKRLKQ